ncbi:MAG: SpoIID/LytB domain-containing protein [Defluviitaleaceae bacterium]|nr:SpoIID/LytB domain-containing protein [Defluviitaleaceae bacterium]
MKGFIFFAAVILFSGCAPGRAGGIGGPLPMIIVNMQNQYRPADLFSAITARSGDDRPVFMAEAFRMLEIAGVALPGMYISEADKLTLGLAWEILRNHLQNEELLITDENRDFAISYALWVDLMLKTLDGGGFGEFTSEKIIPLGQDENRVLSNLGAFNRGGTDFSAYLDKEILVMHREGEIFAIVGLINARPTLRNVFIVESDFLGVTLFSGGFFRTFLYAKNIEPLPENTAITNIQISAGEIIAVKPAYTKIRGTIEQINETSVELREWGALPLCFSFAVYGLSSSHAPGNVTFLDESKLLVGANIADFYIIDGRVAAAIITNDVSPVYIRVVIGTSGFTGLVHENVAITSTGDFTVRGGDRAEIFRAHEVFNAENHAEETADFWGGTRFYIATVNPDDKLEIIGLQRNHPNGANPRYRGNMEISRGASGGFVIVNELCLEQYLYAVVPSEMPASHGPEAAKVQAVTARTFAYHQFYENRFRAYGAHVDDSVISQVYNNLPETEIAIEAVRATRGLVLTYNGEVVIANYFSTSGGTTANSGEVWASGGRFPVETPPHLRAMPQFILSDMYYPLDLSAEDAAGRFFRDTEIPAFDREFAWFRWNVRLTAEELSDTINQSIGVRQAANPALIQKLDATGQATAAPVRTIGVLQNIEITKRGQGGNIMEILLHGTKATVRVKTEFNIRSLLNPGDTRVTRNDGSLSGTLSLLPSAFFVIEPETDALGEILAITFYGGGNGHGVGMSQNGVRALLDMGFSYAEILRHYYPGTEILDIAQLR